jgi:hypothetical protein
MLRGMKNRRQKHPSRITIPDAAVPAVRFFYADARRQNWRYEEIEYRSGVLRQTFKAWRHSNRPSYESLTSVLGALNWSLLPCPDPAIIPPDIREALAIPGLPPPVEAPTA